MGIGVILARRLPPQITLLITRVITDNNDNRKFDDGGPDVLLCLLRHTYCSFLAVSAFFSVSCSRMFKHDIKDVIYAT